MAMRHKAVVLVVVDLVDFDGSFPRAIMDVVTDSGAEVVLVITKVDLVPRYLGRHPNPTGDGLFRVHLAESRVLSLVSYPRM